MGEKGRSGWVWGGKKEAGGKGRLAASLKKRRAEFAKSGGAAGHNYTHKVRRVRRRTKLQYKEKKKDNKFYLLPPSCCL